jgi:hypothetical protein
VSAVVRRRAAATPYALILTSPDGVTWTQRAPLSIRLADSWLGAPGSGMTSVAWSGSTLVAVGIDPGENPAAWYSTNADTWTPVSLPQAAVWLSPLSDITWGNGRFVAVSPVSDFNGHAPVLWSADGINWRSDSAAVKLPPMNAVTAGASEYLAVSNSYRQTSPDSLTWRVFPMSGCGNGVLWDGTRYVSVGDAICRSP